LAVSVGPQRAPDRGAAARLAQLTAAAVTALFADHLEKRLRDVPGCSQRAAIETARITAFGFTGWVMNNQLR